MAVKKTARKKSTTKSGGRRAVIPAKRSAKKAARGGKSLAKKASSAASSVSRNTKKVARGAQNVGRIVSTLGNLVEAGGEAAESLLVEVESRVRKGSGTRKTAGRAKKAALKNATRRKR